MRFICYVILFTTVTLYGTNYNMNKWNKILHYNNKFKVINSEFYLSKENNRTSIQELKQTILLLNSSRSKEIACNFPLRYKFLLDEGLDVPYHDLATCTELNNFIDEFQKENISLVFTSEFINSPSSAFGHIMLILHDNNSSLNIADTIHFAGKTSIEDGFFKYAYKGLAGKYNGYFIREPFFKKIYQYNIIEQRFMYIYKLDYTKQNILNIIYHLYELRKATFKYSFLSTNCSSEIINLLDVADLDKNIRTNSLFYLPIDAVKDLEIRIKGKDKFIPLLNKLDYLISTMTKKELDIFNNIIKTNKIPEHNYSNIINESLVYYSVFNFRKFHRSYKNYNDIMQLKYSKSSINIDEVNPLNKTQPSNIAVGYYNNNVANGLVFEYRPLLIDKYDIQLNKLQESEITLFKLRLIEFNNNLYIDKVDLLNMNSYPVQKNFYMPSSWNIYLGYNKYNVENNLRINASLGLGLTHNIYNSFNSLTVSMGLDNNQIYIQPKYSFIKHISSTVKAGFETYCKQYNHSKDYINNSIFLSIKNNKYLYNLEYIKDNSKIGTNLTISVKYNF